MISLIHLFFLRLELAALASENKPAATKLEVSANHCFAKHADGRLFFHLGDTAEELFHPLNRE